MAGYFSAMAGTLTTASMTGWNSRTVNDIAISGNIVNMEDISSFNNQAGSLVSTGVGYALTGRGTINILNLADFTGGRYNQGLIQLGFGAGGSSLSLGGGGADFSAGSLYNSYKGINEAMKVVNKKYGSFEDQVNLEVANAEGYTNNSDNWALGRAMLEDQVGLNWGNGIYTKEDGTEVSYNGLFDKNNADNITVNEVLKSLKMEDIAKLAAVLSHENTHRLDFKAGRDTYEAAAHYNGMNTYNDLKNAFDLKGDSTFSMQMISALMEPGSYLANAGSADFWKLTTDGRLINDNDADLYLTNTNEEYIDENGNVVDKKDAVKLIDTDTNSVSQALIQYVGMDRAAEMLGVNPADLGNYDDQTLQDVVGMSSDMVARLAVNGQLSFDDFSLDQQQKLVGELLLKSDGQSWEDGKGWNSDSIAEFNISDNWNGYSIGFDQTMTNGEYNKFVVDIVHSRDTMSYFGSTGNQSLKEKFNGMDSSMYFKKDLDGNIISAFSVDQVQTVDNLWGSNFDQTTVQHSFFGTIQGNTLAANDPFFSTYGQSSGSYPTNVFVSAMAQTLGGINVNSGGYDPNPEASRYRWLTHQKTPTTGSKYSWLSSDGCIVNTDENQQYIKNTLNNWQLYNGFNMGTAINEDWSNLIRNMYAYY
ncbi:MAG: hypothetical protein L3J12_04145 [Spirochaetales bacterium]|nr:hypothetical protein [Spirochaetales bacterium]